MPWNFMQIEIKPEDALISPTIGPGDLSREQAHAEVQRRLDRLASASPETRVLAEGWKAGTKDDTAYLGLFAWTIYEHPDGEKPHRAALAWLEDYAETIRSTGLDVSVARLPTS